MHSRLFIQVLASYFVCVNAFISQRQAIEQDSCSTLGQTTVSVNTQVIEYVFEIDIFVAANTILSFENDITLEVTGAPTSLLTTMTVQSTVATTNSLAATTEAPTVTTPNGLAGIGIVGMTTSTSSFRLTIPTTVSKKRQSTSSFLASNGSVVSTESEGALFSIVNGNLFFGNSVVSTVAGTNLPFPHISAGSIDTSAITTTFSLTNDSLVWMNAAFAGGSAQFCQVSSTGQVYAETSADGLHGCTSVALTPVFVSSTPMSSSSSSIISGSAKTTTGMSPTPTETDLAEETSIEPTTTLTTTTFTTTTSTVLSSAEATDLAITTAFPTPAVGTTMASAASSIDMSNTASSPSETNSLVVVSDLASSTTIDTPTSSTSPSMNSNIDDSFMRVSTQNLASTTSQLGAQPSTPPGGVFIATAAATSALQTPVTLAQMTATTVLAASGSGTPAGPSTLQTVVSTAPNIAASATAATGVCSTPPSTFQIEVTEAEYLAQYLYDADLLNDDTLTTTNSSSQAQTFSIASTGQLQMTVTNSTGQVVTLLSEQDSSAEGAEPLFFSPRDTIGAPGTRLPVLASIAPDCTLSLVLPDDGAKVLQECGGVLHLLTAEGVNGDCTDVELMAIS